MLNILGFHSRWRGKCILINQIWIWWLILSRRNHLIYGSWISILLLKVFFLVLICLEVLTILVLFNNLHLSHIQYNVICIICMLLDNIWIASLYSCPNVILFFDEFLRDSAISRSKYLVTIIWQTYWNKIFSMRIHQTGSWLWWINIFILKRTLII